ncbi:MAG: delta-60 repeat domain-containing protein [Gammaproteobacteria bacterium]
MRQLQRITTCLALALAGAHAWAGSPVDSGALDATFGSNGKVILGPNPGETNPVANDVAIQSDGKIMVVGYETNATDGLESWRIARLDANGSVDTGFASNGILDWNAGTTGTRAYAVAMRPDGRIVVGGNFQNEIEVSQFTPNGSPDPSFAGGQGYVLLTPPAGDSNYLSRLIIEVNGTIDVAGSYHQQSTNNNQFLFAQISADGRTVQPLFQYEFGSGNNQDDHAQDLAVDSQGRYVVVGYHRGANGNYDFAAIRILSNLYDVDNTFGSGGQTTVDFGDNGDYANAVALTPTGYIALGGQANGQAALALLDPNGNLNTYFSGGLLYSEKATFVFGSGGGGGIDTIAKLILDGYDTKYPQLLAIGSGFQSGVPYGLMFGIARLDLPDTYSNFSLDTSFNSNGTEGVYFNERLDGLGALTTTNHGRSATFVNGKLIAVGDTIAPGGTNMAVARLTAFDGIFKNGFDNPSL